MTDKERAKKLKEYIGRLVSSHSGIVMNEARRKYSGILLVDAYENKGNDDDVDLVTDDDIILCAHRIFLDINLMVADTMKRSVEELEANEFVIDDTIRQICKGAPGVGAN